MKRLTERLSITEGITALIGSGGKSTLLNQLGRELAECSRVLLTTTTKMYPSSWCPLYTRDSVEEAATYFSASSAVTVGSLTEEGKLKAPSIPFSLLSSLAPYIIAECDGSKRLPLKAHQSYEPVVPEGSHVISVVGLSGIGRPIRETVHRPELFSAIAGGSVNDTVTAATVARVLLYEYAADVRTRFDTLILNQMETEEDFKNARLIARAVTDTVPARVFYGNIAKGELECSL